jgi:hypothetical protein
MTRTARETAKITRPGTLASPLPPSLPPSSRRRCKAFVVNNYVGTDGLDADTHCTDAPGVKGKEELAAFCNVRWEGGREGGREEGNFLPRWYFTSPSPFLFFFSLLTSYLYPPPYFPASLLTLPFLVPRQMLQPTFISKVCPAVFGCLAYGAAMYTLDEEVREGEREEEALRALSATCGANVAPFTSGRGPVNSFPYPLWTLAWSKEVPNSVLRPSLPSSASNKR